MVELRSKLYRRLRRSVSYNSYSHATFSLMSFSFPSPIPANIKVPHWAYLDVIVRYVPTPPSGMFVEYNLIRQTMISTSSRLRMQVRSLSYRSAFADLVLGGPESSAVPGATTSTTPSPFITPISTPIGTSTFTSVAAPSNKVNIGAIVGGTVGGVAFIGILAGLIFIILRRRKTSSSSTYSAYASQQQPMMSDMDMKYNSAVPTMSGRVYVSPAGCH